MPRLPSSKKTCAYGASQLNSILQHKDEIKISIRDTPSADVINSDMASGGVESGGVESGVWSVVVWQVVVWSVVARLVVEMVPWSLLALGGFTQPEPFMQLFKLLARTKDGFLDRILMCSISLHLLQEEEEIELWCDKLDMYSVQGLKGMSIPKSLGQIIF